MEKHITNGEAQTLALGERFSKSLKPGTVVALSGGLGTGKTVFTKGIARGLGIDEIILSPTFTLLRQYDKLNHFDVYRIGDADELDEIGFDELIGGERISVIEWAEKAEDRIPKNAVHVTISRGELDDTRIITIETKDNA